MFKNMSREGCENLMKHSWSNIIAVYFCQKVLDQNDEHGAGMQICVLQSAKQSQFEAQMDGSVSGPIESTARNSEGNV